MERCVLKILWVALLFFSTSIGFSQSKKIKVACIGNSITAGYLLSDPMQDAYPAQLQKKCGDGYDVKIFGYSGATLLRNGHKPYYKTDKFIQALSFKPDIAIIHLGLNDTDPRNWPNYKDDFEADYAWLIDTLRQVNASVKIFICRLSPIFSGHPRFKSGTRDWFWQIQEKIPGIAKENNTGLIDIYNPLQRRPDLFADNLHPDAEGAGIIATIAYQKITGNYGGLNIPSFFNDNMVLQRQQPICFYGKANVGTPVVINFNQQIKKTITDDDGNWKFIFPAMQATGPLQATITNEANNIHIQNIWIGDVWLCSGQSNMAMELKNADDAEEALSHALGNKNLHLLKYEQLAQTDNIEWDSVTLNKINKLEYFSGKWNMPNAKNVSEFSAIAIYFANKISEKENIPIGLIQIAVGGAPIESWISRYTMEQDDLLVDMLGKWRTSDFYMPWVKERAGVNLKNSTNPNQRHPYDPAYIFESAIDSLSHFPIKGILWYQGESNAHNPDLYPKLYKAMLSDWRKKWNSELPFYFVQLSSINRPSWTYFREMQSFLPVENPRTYMAVSLDVGDSLNVHPKNKKIIAERLALLVEKFSYHKNITASGPVWQSIKMKNNRLILSFANAITLSTKNNQPLTGFELVNHKGIFIPANGVIHENKIEFSIPAKEKIKRLVYAWQPFTRANLINEAGLPASAFSINIKEEK
ncbi:MAG: sialate O-acetylesterase [Niastella sp.]|nr:sialate O-acetylesterase [Niastella sp.]